MRGKAERDFWRGVYKLDRRDFFLAILQATEWVWRKLSSNSLGQFEIQQKELDTVGRYRIDISSC